MSSDALQSARSRTAINPPMPAVAPTMPTASTGLDEPSSYQRAEPVKEVRVRANVTRMINVDLQSQCFTAVCRLEASWTAPVVFLGGETTF